jgi:hypothetical protein
MDRPFQRRVLESPARRQSATHGSVRTARSAPSLLVHWSRAIMEGSGVRARNVCARQLRAALLARERGASTGLIPHRPAALPPFYAPATCGDGRAIPGDCGPKISLRTRQRSRWHASGIEQSASVGTGSSPRSGGQVVKLLKIVKPHAVADRAGRAVMSCAAAVADASAGRWHSARSTHSSALRPTTSIWVLRSQYSPT